MGYFLNRLWGRFRPVLPLTDHSLHYLIRSKVVCIYIFFFSFCCFIFPPVGGLVGEWWLVLRQDYKVLFCVLCYNPNPQRLAW